MKGQLRRGSELERNKRVIRQLVEAINAQDYDRLDGLVAPDFIRHSYTAGSPGVRSLDDLKRFLRSEFETFPDAHESIADIVAEGDKVSVRHRFRGTQTGHLGPFPPSGRTMTTEYIAIYRLVAGVIVEAWAEWDNLVGLAQLGHYQPPA